MSRKDWHIQRSDETFVLARHLPVRFDVKAEAVFPLARRGRLAQQIRQDLWRELQSLRGFSPAVQIDRIDGGLRVTAGGRAARPIPADVADKICTLLNSASHRQRWMQWADVRAKSC